MAPITVEATSISSTKTNNCMTVRSLASFITIILLFAIEASYVNGFQTTSTSSSNSIVGSPSSTSSSLSSIVSSTTIETFGIQHLQQRQLTKTSPKHSNKKSQQKQHWALYQSTTATTADAVGMKCPTTISRSNNNEAVLSVQDILQKVNDFTTDVVEKFNHVVKTSDMSGMFKSSIKGVNVALQESWWCFPLFLMLVPLYCAVILNTNAAMPTWWPMKTLDGSFFLSTTIGKVITGGFLFSNISYFISGCYLLNMFPSSMSSKFTSANTAKYPLLGQSLIASGLISTIFHSMQALGSNVVAEGLCYMDHGIAISTGLYYLKTCGYPSKSTLLMGILSLITLAYYGPGYAFLHAAWHYLSAFVAVIWAKDGLSYLE